MHNVISYYALTDGFRARIEKEGRPTRFIAIGRLRNFGLRAMLAEIRKLKADLMTIAIESDGARPLVGPLTLLAALSGSRRLRIYWPDGTTEEISRWQVLRQLVRVGRDQVVARAALHSATRQMKRLENRTAVARPGARSYRRVLYLDANLSFGVAAGGSVGHIKGVIDGFLSKGYEVDYVSVKPIPTDAAGARWVPVPAPGLYAFPTELNYFPFNRSYERLVENLAREGRYAFLYQRMSMHNFSGAVLRQRLNLPLVLEYNGSEAWVAANWSEKLSLHDTALGTERTALRAADVIVTISEPLRDELIEGSLPPERIVTYPNGIDPRIFDPTRFSEADHSALRARWGILADARVVTFIGTFGRWHGVDFLARAIRRLIEEERAWVEANKLHFLLIGDGLKMQEVTNTIGDSRFAPFVTLTGLVPQKEAPAYLAASNIFLATHVPNPDGSAFFGSPTKLFEYMAMERPIIASDLNQVGAVLKGERDGGVAGEPLGRLFVPGNEDEFLRALRDVVDDPQRAQAMAERARAEALSKYTWDHHVGAILERTRELAVLDQPSYE